MPAYGKKLVLRDINLSIAPSRTLSILGPNGAGKTTLLNLISGLIKPPPNSISYNGKQYNGYSPRQMAALVGYVPQLIVPAFDYSVIDYVVTGCAPQLGAFQRPARPHYEAAMKSLLELGIEHLTEKSYRQISGGERQQVSIARVLTQSPEYILMDEPTAHLDYGNQLKVLNTIKRLGENGFGVVFTTHNTDQALLAGGRTAVIDRNGHLQTGDSGELLSETFLSELYGVTLRVSTLENRGRNICYAPNLGDDCRYGPAPGAKQSG